MAIGYIPSGQTGQGGQAQQTAVQQQQTTQQASGVAAAIRAADASLQAKKNEARRIYERAQTQMREDLNTVAGFDASVAGTDAAPAIRQAADALKEQIRDANDPVEAQALIADFRQKYNLLKAREEQRVEDAAQLNSMSTATGSQMADLNSALPPGMEYDEVDAGTVARADEAFKKNFQYVDGKIMVEGPDGNLVPLDEADFINDTSMYQPSQRKADVGDLQTSAMQENVQNRILTRGGGVFKEKFARMEYDTLAENSNRNGSVLRMQISEDYLDESGNSSFFNNQQEAKAFELGPNGFSRVEGNPEMEQAWREVWGDPGAAREKDESGNVIAQGSGWDLLNQEREKFVEYARTSMDSSEILRRQQIRAGNQEEPSRYTVGGLAANTQDRIDNAVREGMAGNPQAPGYTMVALTDKEGGSDPIIMKGSDAGLSEGGEYRIDGFGVDPLYGINSDGSNFATGKAGEGQMMASITVVRKEMQYKGPGGETLSEDEFNNLSQEQKYMYTSEEVETKTPRKIKIGPGTDASPEGRAIYARLMKDPEALRLMQAEQQKARKTRGDYLFNLGANQARKQAEEDALQAQENEAAILEMDAASFEAQKEFDQQKLDKANARRAEQRSKEIISESFTDDNVVSRVSGVPVYFPPSGSSYIKDGKWYTSAGGKNPIGRVYLYTDSEGKTQKGMAPLRG